MDENAAQQPVAPQKSNMGLIVVCVLLLALVGGGLAYFASQNKSQPATTQQEQSPTAAPAAEETSPTATEAMTTGETKTFTISGKSFSFTPNEIRVKKGDTVKITFKNTGGFHDFSLDELNVKTPQIQSGQTADVEFVADKIGTFEFYCSVGNHRAQGMKGTLIVE